MFKYKFMKNNFEGVTLAKCINKMTRAEVEEALSAVGINGLTVKGGDNLPLSECPLNQLCAVYKRHYGEKPMIYKDDDTDEGAEDEDFDDDENFDEDDDGEEIDEHLKEKYDECIKILTEIPYVLIKEYKDHPRITEKTIHILYDEIMPSKDVWELFDKLEIFSGNITNDKDLDDDSLFQLASAATFLLMEKYKLLKEYGGTTRILIFRILCLCVKDFLEFYYKNKKNTENDDDEEIDEEDDSDDDE